MVHFSLILESFPNIVESLLFIYIISHSLPLRKPWDNKWLLVVIQFCIVTFFSNIITIAFLHSILLFLTDLFLTYLYTEPAPTPSKLFYGSIFTFITFLSEKAAIFSSEWIIGYPIKDIGSVSIVRYWIIFLYILLLFLFSFICVHFKKYIQKLPKFITITALLGITFCVIISELLLHNIILLEIQIQYDTSSLQVISIGFFGIILLLFFLILYLVKLYETNLKLIEQQQQTQLEKQLVTVINANLSLRHWKHDIQNQLKTLAQLLHMDEYQKGKVYISELLEDFQFANYGVYTYNATIDATLAIKFSEIHNHHINLIHEIYFCSTLQTTLHDAKLVAILCNLLDNAIDACKKVPNDAKIHFSMKSYHSQLIIEITNSSDGKYKYNEKQELITTKQKEGHGNGIRRIQTLVEAAGGMYNFDPHSTYFSASILLPMNAKTNKTGGISL